MSNPVIAVVTGANRGIGKAICQSLASSISEPLVLYTTSRKGVDLGLEPSSSKMHINYSKLDIADSMSIKSLAALIQQDHAGVDVLINNAGVNLDDQYSPDNVRKTLDTNYRGTLNMCQTFIPILRKNGRIVNVSSIGSTLKLYSDDLKKRFRSSELTLQALEDMIVSYQACVDHSTESQNGWPVNRQSYSVSKASINALTAILARENPEVFINACCPGWVSTDMGKMVGTPTKHPVDGAKIPIRLGFKDIGGVSGRYWANPSLSGKGEGQVMEW